MKKLSLVSALCGSLFLCCCATAKAPVVHSFEDIPPLEIKCSVGVKEPYILELAENGTTGYTWSTVSASKECTVKLEHIAGDARLCGAPGKIRVTITPLTKAPVVVKLQYARPWEKDVKPVHTVTCRLTPR